MPALPRALPRPDKRVAGRTAVHETPLSIRGDVELGDGAEQEVRAKLGRALRPMATRIERVSLRFDAVSGPRGGAATRCRAKVVLSGKESVVVEERGRTPAHAVARVTPVLRRTLKRRVERRGGKAPAPSRTLETKEGSPPAPERAPRRTVKKRTHGMTAALEEPSDTPSRKSTRGSANRAKAGSTIGRAVKRRKHSPAKRRTRST